MKRGLLIILLIFVLLSSSCVKQKHVGDDDEGTLLPELQDAYDPSLYPEDPFEDFMKFPGDYGTFFGKVPFFDLNLPENIVGVRFSVLNVSEISGDFTVYCIKVKEVYGSNLSFDSEKIYTMAFRGTEKNPLYGRPTLEVGKEYVRLASDNFEQFDHMQATLYYKVVDELGGTYVYGYGVDFSEVECAVKIVDSQENAIYEVDKHDKILAYLNAIGQEIPVFEYKCEINALIKEIQER